MKLVPIAVNTYKRFGRKSRKERLDRPEYAAMLRARPASTWEKMPPMISIPSGNTTKPKLK